jgi:hypothetical protein
MGGAAEGITSGLDRPGYKDGTDNRVARLTDEFQQRKAMFDQLRPQQTGFMPGSASSFLTNFGLNLLAQSPRGNIFQTAAVAAQDPFKQFQAARASEISDQKQLDQAILGDVISEDFKSRQQQELIDADYKEKLLDIDKAIRVEKQKGINANQELITKYEYDRKLLQDDYEFQKKYGVTGGKSYDPGAAVKTANLIKSLDDEKLALRTEQSELLGVLTGDRTAEQKQRIKEIEVRLGSIDQIKSNILKETSLIEKIGMLDMTDTLNTAVDENMAKGMSRKDATIEALKQFEFLQNMADGGRAGYNVGGMTGMAAPQQTSQTIQESPAQDLTYAELRSRLPNSISDQVVQLLANSKQALLDFAEIRTQQDVDQFNQQYDVTLTLPQEG